MAGVEIKMIVRGIFCAMLENKKFKKPPTAISIVDEYLEHARVMIFHNDGKERVFLSSADWMVRNLDHRVEAAIEVTDPSLKTELMDIIHIQLRDNVKARILNQDLSNNYVPYVVKKPVRSQIETYQYLNKKT
jgi:polyphosphate kinase